MSAGICQYCGCTEARGCAAGCGWVDDARDFCNLCFLGEHVVRFVFSATARITGETPPDWGSRPLPHRRALTMAARGLLEALPSTAAQELDVLREQLSGLMQELEARAPETVDQCRHESATLKDTVLAVFDPPGRIVLASSVPPLAGGAR